MAFGNWSGGDTRNEDPWLKTDRTEQRDTQCRHDPEPELRGSKPFRRRAAKPNRTAVITIVSILVIIAIISSIIFSAFLAVEEFFSSGTTIMFDPSIGQLPDNFGSTEDFFENYFQAGGGSGRNYMERISPPGIELELIDSAGEMMSIQDIYDKCSPSIVGITAQMDSGYGWGTGVIMTEDGYIITNSHVLDDSTEATVTLFNDEEYPAKLVGYDSFTDIAVIKIECTGLTPAEFGNSAALRVGDDVVAIGNPLGIELRGTMTDGIVSAINREVNMDGHMMTLIQTNAQINGGNSGGALIDMYGRVIGITNMKMMALGTSVEGLGFAIPINTVKTVADEILSKGYVEGRPGIGVTVVGISAHEENGVSYPAGVYVSEVTPNSGADIAGIESEDIITHADGKEVFSSADLNLAKADKGIGDVLILTVWRNGEVMDFEVEIMDMNSLFN